MQRKAWLIGTVGLIVSAGVIALAACVGDDPGEPATPGVDSGGPGASDSNPSTVDGAGSSGNPDITPEGGPDGGASQCATATGTYLDAGTLPFYGSHQGVAATSNGWVFAGFYRNSASYGPDGGVLGDGGDPTQSASVARVDQAGNVIWQQGFGGTGTEEFDAVTTDEHDNVYAAGWFDSTSFTIGSTPVSNSTGAELGVVVKLDAATGNPLWVQTFVPGTFGFGCGAIDYANGHLVVTCSMGLTQAYKGAGGASMNLTSGQVTASAVYGLDPETGNALWADSFSTHANANTSFETDVFSVDVTDSTVVIAGRFNGDTMTDKTAVNISPTGDLYTGFVAELTADGLYHFAKGFGGTADAGTVDAVTAAGTSADGGVFVGGKFRGTVGFGGSLHASVGAGDAFLVWLANKAGAPDWEKTVGGTGDDAIFGVRLDPCGRPTVKMSVGVGSAVGKIDGVTIPAPQNGAASIIAKYAANGTLLWASGTSNGGDEDRNGINAQGFGIDSASHTRIVGNFRGQIDFGSGTVSVGASGSTPYYVEYAP